MKYLYEIHCHTSEVSKCAKISAADTVRFYKSKGFSGVCITDHFIGGNATIDRTLPWKEQIDLFFKSYEIAKEEGEKQKIKVFRGLEYSYAGTDFLVYGLSPLWLKAHPELADLRLPHRLDLMRENGAFIIHAHPFREAQYIDMLRLLPRNVDGVEVLNACRTDFENNLADQYADNYSLPKFCGSDNHVGELPRLCAMAFNKAPETIEEIISLGLKGEAELIQIKSDNI